MKGWLGGLRARAYPCDLVHRACRRSAAAGWPRVVEGCRRLADRVGYELLRSRPEVADDCPYPQWSGAKGKAGGARGGVGVVE